MGDVTLRPMSAEEYEAFREWGLEEYADEIARAARIPADAARDRAARDTAALLPDGFATEGHRFFVAEEDGRRVGTLWFAAHETRGGRVAWLYDVVVDEDHRRRGVGRRIMQLLEDEVREAGFGRIELNVWGHNEGARHLYESLGYVEIGRQLFKELNA